MKLLPSKAAQVAAALFALTAASASAQTLLTDNYTVDSNQPDPNYELSNGRQGGTLATISYVKPASGNIQVGNTATYPAPASGETLLLATGTNPPDASVYLNYDFSQINAPISISFNGLIANNRSTDPNNWIAFDLLSNPGTQTNFPTTTDYGVLFRANSTTTIFNEGTGSAGNTSASAGGFNVYQNYTIVLSDTAGTGSAFAGNGTVISDYENGVLLNTTTVPNLADGYVGFAAADIAGLANLSISVVPEPGSIVPVALAMGLLGFGFWKHSCRTLASRL